MKTLFTAWLFISGSWVHGSAVDGWSPYEMKSEEACQAAVEAAVDRYTNVVFTCESELPATTIIWE